MVGYSDAVRIAFQIMQDMMRFAKGWLGVDNPVFLRQGVQKRLEGRFVGQPPALAVKGQLVVVEGFAQSIHELSAKDLAEHFHRQQESVS